MQAIVETLFDAAYLLTVITMGILMIIKSNGNRQYRLFGIMAVVLGAGDAFHLIPRAWRFAQPVWITSRSLWAPEIRHFHYHDCFLYSLILCMENTISHQGVSNINRDSISVVPDADCPVFLPAE